MKIVLSHPTGNRNVRAILKSLLLSGFLAEFQTTIAVNSNDNWVKFLPAKIREELLRRSFEVPRDLVRTHEYLEIARMTFPKLGLDRFVTPEKGFASIYSVYKDFDKFVAKRLVDLSKETQITAIYAYEDGALESFKQAKALGVKCIYDLPIAYWETGRKLMREEADRLPQWANTLGGGILDSQEKLDRKTQEMELADIIIGPGSFVMNSVPAWAQHKKMIVAPFGSPETNAISLTSLKTENRPLRVLFVGSMGQRKGLGDLFEAVKLLNSRNIELVVMGSLMESLEFYKNQLASFTYEKGRPHHEVLQLMRSCDVFCLPSIVEGRALVMQEAMSQGLPLIITANTGGSDLIIEGKTGFLVPIRSPAAIADKLNWFLDNRPKILLMGENAKKHALKYTWKKYGELITNTLKSDLS